VIDPIFDPNNTTDPHIIDECYIIHLYTSIRKTFLEENTLVTLAVLT